MISKCCSDIKSGYQQKTHDVSDLSKLDYLLHKGPYTQGPSSTKILGLTNFRFISSLSKITDQIWCNNNSAKATRQKKWAVGWRGWGWTKFEKEGVLRQFFFNWDSLYGRLNSHYEECSCKKNKYKKITAYRKPV